MRVIFELAVLTGVLALSSSAAPSSPQNGDFPPVSASCDMVFRVEVDGNGNGCGYV